MHLFAIILLVLSSRYKGIILCFKYYFRLSPHLRDYMVYAMTIFLTWMVGRAGVEPAQPQAGDLQSLGLTTCSVSPKIEKPISVLIPVYTNRPLLSSR